MQKLLKQVRQRILDHLDRPLPTYKQLAFNDMDQLYRAVQPGDVILVEGDSEMSRLIKVFTQSHWSHVALYVGDALIQEKSILKHHYLSAFNTHAKHMIVEAFSGKGVIAAPLNKYQHLNIRICRPFGILDTDLARVIEDVVHRIGTRYDNQNIIDLALIAFQSFFRPQTRLSLKACLGNCNHFQVICSGMIAQAFQAVSYPIIPEVTRSDRAPVFEEGNPYGGCLKMKHYTQISPRDFDLSPNFDVIKYNLNGLKTFRYKSLWVDKL